MEPTPAGESASQKTLSPAEVHNVAFKKPPIGKRGYDEEEVDYFLDVVETELARLIEANEALRNGSGVDSAGASQPDPRLVEENNRLAGLVANFEHQQSQAGTGSQDLRVSLQTAEQRGQELQARLEAAESQIDDGRRAFEETQRQLEQTQGEAQEFHRAAEQARAQIDEARAQAEQARADAEQARADAEQARAQAEEALARANEAPAAPDASQQAVKVLMLAQQTADQHLSGVQAEADRLLTEARAEAERLTEQSTNDAEQRVTDAQFHAETVRRESTAQAAQRVDDAEAHAASVVDSLETRKATLERRLEELSVFEREYRSRLKSYLESQLRDLQLGAEDADADADVAG